jgi:hypothetical protein
MTGHVRRSRWLLAGAALTAAGLLAATGASAQAPSGPAVPVLHWQPCTAAGEAGSAQTFS